MGEKVAGMARRWIGSCGCCRQTWLRCRCAPHPTSLLHV